MLKKFSLLLVIVLLTATPALAQGKAALSLFGGWATGTESNPIDGRDGDSGPNSSSMDSTWTVGGEAYYSFASGVEVGVGAQYLSFLTKAARSGRSEEDWSTINAVPVYLVGRYRLKLGQQFTWFGEGGVGYTFTSSDKEKGINDMQTGLGESVNLSTSDNAAYFLGTGVGYSLSDNWMLSLGARYWWLTVDSDLATGSLGTFSKTEYKLNNFQLLLGITWFFGFN
ncbi:MAG: porin family protein [Desulfarculaceae bacterium]|nr:porin family protein [Desulfarculaceae bacterium]